MHSALTAGGAPSLLYHFSEEPAIRLFEPRILDSRPGEPAMVWAIDEFHAPHYFLPRDCPRVCFWSSEETTLYDAGRFFGHSAALRVIAVESGWLERISSTSLYRYSFLPGPFSVQDANAGYYISLKAVQPVKVEPVGDLLEALVASGVELRITPSLMPLRQAIIGSTLGFSMIRLRYHRNEIEEVLD